MPRSARRLPVLFAALAWSAPGLVRAQEPAIAAIARQFDTHPVVMLGELHRSRPIHAFLQRLLHAPEFACRIDDVVVEFGNARLQATADAYVAGKPVDEARLRRIWRETAVPFTWNAPMYRQVLDTVRDLNARHACAHRLRVVLADPPLDWSRIRTVRDYARWTDRDASHARIIEREVLAKHHRALYLAGEYHAMKQVPAELRGARPTAAQRLERRHPGALFAIVTVPGETGARALGLGAAPDFRVVDGAIAGITGQIVQPDTAVTLTQGEDGPIVHVAPDRRWPRLGDMFDGVLWVGPPDPAYPPPSIYAEPAYQRELRRRIGLIKAYGGQDFGPALDDLLRQARQAER